MAKVIKVENISKVYQLGEFGTGTISRDLERFWARMRGKEDPFLKIGETNDRSKKGDSDVVWSLKDINFEIEQGDAVGIIGRNGAGKSTLLKILSRVTSPTAGSVKVKGRIASLLEVGTGFHPELTGKENIYLNGAILGMRKAEIKRKFDEIVDFSGVERYIDTPVKRYSSGMYVRLAFAVAAHLESEILIVDEVLAVGDAEFQKKCLGKMNDESKGEGRTVLFVSHNMGSITQLCKSAILLKDGCVLNHGITDKITSQYLSLGASSQLKYVPDIEKAIEKKEIYIKEAFTSNIKGEINDSYGFYENVKVNLTIKVIKYHGDVKIGIALLDKFQSRVFTVVENLNSFYNNLNEEIKIQVEFPSAIIAPNIYSLTIATFIPTVKVFDLIENVCSFKIHDMGSSFAQFEGIDYGSIIIKSEWRNV